MRRVVRGLLASSSAASAQSHMSIKRLHSWDITIGSSSLCVPLFIALGRYDYTVPYVLWEGIAKALPSATLQIFEQSGHQPFFEEPGDSPCP